MKTNYLIIGIVAVVIILVAGIYFYFSPKDVEGGVPFQIYGTDKKIVMQDIPLNEDSARILAEKAINNFDEADYKSECLIFESAEKRVDTRNGEEFWSVGFTCNEECDKTYINCGAAVSIKENTREVRISFPD